MDKKTLETTITKQVSEAKQIFSSIISSSKLPATTGTCLYSCVFLKSFLEKFTNAKSVIVRGGSKDCGVKIDGRWEGHYWCEAEVDSQTWLIDITIDQFLSVPFICEPKEQLIIEYLAGEQDEVEEHLAELTETIKGSDNA